MTEEKKITRRNFLRAAGLVGGAAAVAACAAPAPAPAPTAAPAAAAAPTEAPAAAPTAAPVVGKPFDGKTLKMHAISGGNYEELYKLIPAWEEKTGAKVEFVFKGNGFETDKRLVQDMSAGTVDYDVCWDHSSFFSQYVKLDGLEPIDNHFSAGRPEGLHPPPGGCNEARWPYLGHAAPLRYLLHALSDRPGHCEGAGDLG